MHMASTTATTRLPDIDEREYRKRIRAWTLYDWANSAFATTILAAVLPTYYSAVAGATLPSRAIATSYWSAGLSISLFIAAILAPILGTVSDVVRGKKRFLAVFSGIGIVATALLVLVGTGDWMLASVLAVIGRVGFNGAISFYDSLLPHVARPADQDAVSTRGYAMGYLGGGLLLAINVVMIQVWGGEWGARISFVSVALWWLIFSLPLFFQVPEPRAATSTLKPGESVIGISLRRIVDTVKDMRHYGELFKFLIAFLIYNDAIGTIIGVAAIYGAELGFGTVELVLALLLVQFVGIPFSLIFGRLPNPTATNRARYLAFICFNLIALPLVGILGTSALPQTVTGAPASAFTAIDSYVGEGDYTVADNSLTLQGDWESQTVSAAQTGSAEDVSYAVTTSPGSRVEFPYNGQSITVTYGVGPDYGQWAVEMDGEPLADSAGQPIIVNGYNPVARFEETETFTASAPGQHTLALINLASSAESSTGTRMSIEQIQVLPAARQSNLLLILGALLAVQLVGLSLAWLFGKPLFGSLANTLNTKRSIILALIVYSVIAVWGFFLNSTFEYWFLAWMVAIVQGGSQALSRSLYAAMSPKAKSGEFFGLFGVMEKFAGILGPALFAIAAVWLGSSRPAILSLIVFFIVGGLLLMLVNVNRGIQLAQAEDQATMKPI
jgi:MFS transporter, UMF1 family